ncbi:MAG: LPS biosynthesis protein [Candidatus Marinimicrobia bacterium]|nr:LPS biosynthesis protein [Candidatus Neomarinimicrobiota bacterium]|tara:strand:- start:3238 stop:4443 length:1206 start_codon:yes stop_codon:yes gene_type:complete
MFFCNNCLYPNLAATPLTFEDGLCSGCRVHNSTKNINWDERYIKLKKLFNSYKSTNSYDVVIPVSGGKDSYWQTHVATKLLNLKPLLVTYHGNNYTEAGERNLLNMRKVFDCDHIIFRPSEYLLKKMNKIGFKLQGDMNWHNHCGIFTYPIQVAVNFKVPLILWGEHGFMDIAGMYSYNDYIEFTAKYRKEHILRGFDWYDFTDEGLKESGNTNIKEGITEKDLLWAKYPSDDEIDEVGVRGIYLSNYLPWQVKNQVEEIKRLYNWESNEKAFERTYRLISNLDDIYENGIHDYMKFVKFGYGRATDHASKDIRNGLMTREKGIEYILKHDHIKSRDLFIWLDYVGMTEEEFDSIADTFRDPRVWYIKDNNWFKKCIDNKERSYGPVNLKREKIDIYTNKK